MHQYYRMALQNKCCKVLGVCERVIESVLDKHTLSTGFFTPFLTLLMKVWFGSTLL